MSLHSNSSKDTSTSTLLVMPACEHLDRADNVSYVQAHSSHLELGFFSYTGALYQALTCNFLRAVLAHWQTSQLLLQDLPVSNFGPRTKLLVIFSLGEVGKQSHFVGAWPLISLHLKHLPDTLVGSSGF